MAGQSAGKVAYKETSNQSGGRGSGAATKKVSGPAVGHSKTNPTKGGGIHRATKGG